MISLELTEEEAFNLRTLLGMHSTNSAYDTYPVFEKLSDAMDADLPIDQQVQIGMEEFNRSQKIRRATTITTNGLIEIGERA